MVNLFTYLDRDVSILKRLEKTIKNGDNGIFFDFYYSIPESEIELKKKGYRDIYYYNRVVDGVEIDTIRFYTRLVQDDKKHPKIIISKIEIY